MSQKMVMRMVLIMDAMQVLQHAMHSQAVLLLYAGCAAEE
jgi:hypothetical protein